MWARNRGRFHTFAHTNGQHAIITHVGFGAPLYAFMCVGGS
jgi:hypothetical protein